MSAPEQVGEGPLHGLVTELLREQQEFTAVERFSQRHTDQESGLQARYYDDLIPLGRLPLAGQQLAFRVDLDGCTGCKACVTACHNLNGLDPGETWRDVGVVLGEGADSTFQQTVTTTCHHCEDPACLNGCPVRAYEKDPLTGIVRHLDDQCIGCQYCVLTCPYDVPKYNKARGIVRKCDMCADRLGSGEAPACVQGCPNSAISIEIVDRQGPAVVRDLLPGLNGAMPPASYTRPTTRYVTARPERAILSGDHEVLRPAERHDPLAVMLVLMQLSVGLLCLDPLLNAWVPGAQASQPLRLLLAAGSGALGLGVATLHLGRPLYAFRAFLGWRTSWMSREILAFGAYVPLTVATAAAGAVVAWNPWDLQAAALATLLGLEATAIGFGLLGTLCSVMVYVDTRREFWAFSRTAPKFVATAVLLGCAGSVAATVMGATVAGSRLAGVVPLVLLGLAVGALKLAYEVRFLRLARASDSSNLARSAQLLTTQLSDRFHWRVRAAAVAGAAGVAVAISVAFGSAAGVACAAALAFSAALAGELLERHLHFTAEASRAMPGH